MRVDFHPKKGQLRCSEASKFFSVESSLEQRILLSGTAAALCAGFQGVFQKWQTFSIIQSLGLEDYRVIVEIKSSTFQFMVRVWSDGPDGAFGGIVYSKKKKQALLLMEQPTF